MKRLSSLLVAAMLAGAGAPALANLELAQKKACLACHSVDNKIVGPAYKDVAKKYKGQKGIEAKLVEKVMKGGKGSWGEIPMPANTQVNEAEAKQLVHEALQPAIRFTKDQCLDLPPVLTMTREVPLTPQQAKYYNLLKEQMLVQAAGETISAVNAAASVSKLLQISCGAAYTDDKEVVEFDSAPRLNVLEEILEETERKVIIFAMFRSTIDTIYNHLLKRNITAEFINGAVTPPKRADIIRRFQNEDNPRVLVMQPQATAHGITLTRADTVVFYGPLMSVEQYTQAIARADRKGQNSDKVTVIHIQGSPIEKKMFKALESKVSDNLLITQMFENEIIYAKGGEIP